MENKSDKEQRRTEYLPPIEELVVGEKYFVDDIMTFHQRRFEGLLKSNSGKSIPIFSWKRDGEQRFGAAAIWYSRSIFTGDYPHLGYHTRFCGYDSIEDLIKDVNDFYSYSFES